MKKNKHQVLKDKIKRKLFLKTEIKKIILKSILQNFYIKNIERADASKKLAFFKNRTIISKQVNVCLSTGRCGGVYKKYNVSRHYIKQLAKFNFLQNTKIKSW